MGMCDQFPSCLSPFELPFLLPIARSILIFKMLLPSQSWQSLEQPSGGWPQEREKARKGHGTETIDDKRGKINSEWRPRESSFSTWHYWHLGPDNPLLWEAVLCTMECLAATLASTHQVPKCLTHFHIHTHTIRIISRYPLGNKNSPL